LPSWAIDDEVMAGKLSQLHISGHRLNRSVAMISLGRFQQTPTRSFITYVLRHKERLQVMARSDTLRQEDKAPRAVKVQFTAQALELIRGVATILARVVVQVAEAKIKRYEPFKPAAMLFEMIVPKSW